MAQLSKSWNPELTALEQQMNQADQSDQNYADQVAGQALTSANSYADTKKIEAISAANSYADNSKASNSDAAISSSSSLTVGSVSAIPDDPSGWSVNYNLKLTNSNNALTMYVGGQVNDRKAMIQAGHASAPFANSLGQLQLNPLGGAVSINGFSPYHTGNFTPPEDREAGAVGTTALLYAGGTSGYFPGATQPGSNLEWATASGWREPQENPSGTWRLMGTIRITGSAEERTSLWLRIS